MKTFIIQLKDENELYQDYCIKTKANNISEVLKRFNNTKINELVSESFSNKDYNFKIISIYDFDLIYEI